MSDLDIIKKIEQTLNVELKKLDETQWNNKGYTLNQKREVTGLSLCECEIENINIIISPLKDLTRLTELYLFQNQISNISPLKDLTNLTKLNLGNNKLSDISPLIKLTNLTYLRLHSNQLSDISTLKNLNNLVMLSLSQNKISAISPLKNLKKLTQLTLFKNQIEKLPQWITHFEMNISWSGSRARGCISISDNPIKNPPIEIVKQGKEAIRNYFASLEEKKKVVKLNEVRILLVGDGMAGKTSLLKQIQGFEFNENESQTHGINVITLHSNNIPELANLSKIKDCQLHFWDFGGQEIMHASHQFFLSERSLYILVLDSRTDSKKYYWLKHIEKYGGNSPLIVVMNKIDENQNYNVEQKKINDSFPNIENRFFRISCKKREGIPEYLACLGKTIPETSLFGTDINIDWLTIKDRLIKETKANNYISRDGFIKICKENNIADKSSQLTLLKFLHDLGVVLFFEKLKLANIYVLDPHWVTIGVYKIINSAKTKDGLLKEQDLDYILNKEVIKKEEYDPAREKKINYSFEEQRYIIEIMMQFELCYEYDSKKNYYIIPDLLPKELENEPMLNEGTPLHFVMKYDYLPSPIISRLMIRFKNDIVKDQQWKYGMILENDEFNCKAKIKSDEQSKAIVISIQGELRCKRDYFSAIRHHLNDINRSFENLKIDGYIPLSGHPEILIEYKELLGYESAARDEYFVGKLGKSFSVSQMLDSVISKEERSKEMDEKQNIIFNVNPQQNVTQHVTQHTDQTVTQQQTVTQEVKTVQGLFKNLKEDILGEVDIEIEDEKEKKRIKNELQKVENAFNELEKAASEDKKEIDEGTKSRIGEFIDNLSDKNSRINKAFKLVTNGAEKVQKLGRVYNKFSQHFALPPIPPILLGKEDKE